MQLAACYSSLPGGDKAAGLLAPWDSSPGSEITAEVGSPEARWRLGAHLVWPGSGTDVADSLCILALSL